MNKSRKVKGVSFGVRIPERIVKIIKEGPLHKRPLFQHDQKRIFNIYFALLLNSVKAVLQIREDIVDVFRAD